MTLETTDIFRGAFFLSQGGRVHRVSLSPNRHLVSFIIAGENLSDLDDAYRSGKAVVNPLQLRESLNHLRDLLFKTLRENERRRHGDIQRGDRGRQARP